MSSGLSKYVNAPGICDPACLRKFKALLSERFMMHSVLVASSDNLEFKARLERADLPKEIHVEIFTNGKVGIKASPHVQANFKDICVEIEAILKEAVDILSRKDAIRVKRAERILEYVEELSVGNEIERMVVAALCDIVLDLLVTEKLSRFTRRREDLENESIGAKISILEKTIPVYRSQAIRDIRDLRNKVAHGGLSTPLDEARFVKKATIDIFETF